MPLAQFLAIIYGGHSPIKATGNSVVTQPNGDKKGNFTSVYGEYGAEANNNKVDISGGEFSERVYAGYAKTGNANKNKVEITGDSIKISGEVDGGQSSNEANNNTVTITAKNSAEINKLYGGHGDKGASSNNTVVLNGPIKVVVIFMPEKVKML